MYYNGGLWKKAKESQRNIRQFYTVMGWARGVVRIQRTPCIHHWYRMLFHSSNLQPSTHQQSLTHTFLWIWRGSSHATIPRRRSGLPHMPRLLKYARSRSLYAIARPSVVCNVRGAPYSGGSNFRQYLYGIRYPGHTLTSTENFTEIVPGEPLRRGS